MKVQNLIILGTLKERPRHGYEIKKVIQRELGIFTALENKSIYYPLKVMERQGLIKRTTAEAKGRLTRYVYAITDRGDKEFMRLAMDALLSEKRPFIEIDIPLYFLPYLENKEILARLRLRKRFLEKVKGWLADKLEAPEQFPPHHILLLRHHLNLLNAEESFVDEIIRIIKEQSR